MSAIIVPVIPRGYQVKHSIEGIVSFLMKEVYILTAQSNLRQHKEHLRCVRNKGK